MNIRNGSWQLALHELKKDRWGYLFTLAFIFYLMLFLTPTFIEALEDRGRVVFIWIVDFFNITLLPVLGFVFNRSTMNYIKTDYHTQKLAQYRMMPIPLKNIVGGRLIQLWVVLTLSHIVYFTVTYLIINYVGEDLITLTTYVLYALTWYSYSLAIAVTYVYWEIGYTAKLYLLVNFMYVGVYIILSIVITALLKGSISLYLIKALEQGNWWIPALAVLVAIGSFIGGAKIIEQRVGRRHLAK